VQSVSAWKAGTPAAWTFMQVFAHVAVFNPKGAANVRKLWQHGGNLSVFYRTRPDNTTMEDFKRAWTRIDGGGTTHYFSDDEIEVKR